MIGRTNTGGGGGGLNFKVIPNPLPNTAKENTIWVDTDKINNYYFSATQPENMVDHDVWFLTGTSSAVAFSATKKKLVMVYPLSAKQHIDGALVDVTAKSYQNGEWVGWISYIVKGGVIQPIGFSTNVRTNYPAKVAEYDGYLEVAAYHTSTGGAYETSMVTDEKIDLSNVSKIVMDVDVLFCGTTPSNAPFKGVSIIVVKSIGHSSAIDAAGAVVAYAITTTTGRQTIELELDGKNLGEASYYIGIGLGFKASGSTSTPNKARIYDFYYE